MLGILCKKYPHKERTITRTGMATPSKWQEISGTTAPRRGDTAVVFRLHSVICKRCKTKLAKDKYQFLYTVQGINRG
jgi:hypothetical protein